jgi:hypothetical protein
MIQLLKAEIFDVHSTRRTLAPVPKRMATLFSLVAAVENLLCKVWLKWRKAVGRERSESNAICG